MIKVREVNDGKSGGLKAKMRMETPKVGRLG